jgi:hypothetical protein
VAGSGLSPYQPDTPTQPLPTAAPTTAAPTTAPPTTAPPVVVPEGVYLTGDGTIDDSGSVGVSADADWVPATPPGTSGYEPDPQLGQQVFSFDGSDGLMDPGIRQLGTSDFTVSFDFKTGPSDSGKSIDLLGYRPVCQLGSFFDVRIGAPNSGPPVGILQVELDQPNKEYNLYSTSRVDNNVWHHVQITRDDGSVTLSVDTATVSTLPYPTSLSLTNSATAWQIANGDSCTVGTPATSNASAQPGDGTVPLDGELANIYVGPPTSAILP